MVNSMIETKPKPVVAGQVLLIEDSIDDAWVARRAFRRHHIDDSLTIFGSGEDALTYLRSCGTTESESPPCPRVILLDLKLPGIRGHEVLRQIREDEHLKLIPVVVVSSSENDRDVNESYRLGANSYVRKQYGQPQPGEYLVTIVQYWLQSNLPPI
jgi:CheY-like chemotaxis protein